MIPISTAMYDPKWFHNFGNNLVTFIDNNGVINGIRSDLLVPKMQPEDGECKGQENGKCLAHSDANYSNCKFLSNYRKQLQDIDFYEFYNNLQAFAVSMKELLNLDKDPILVFMVYETVNNPCSERVTIQEFFKSNGVACDELKYPIKENY